LTRTLDTKICSYGCPALSCSLEDSVVITNNAREFLRIPGVAVEEWTLT
jgi:predicted nucleic acid-binding protein